MLIEDQIGIIQNLQMFPIPQTSFLVWTFSCQFLHQDDSYYYKLKLVTFLVKCGNFKKFSAS